MKSLTILFLLFMADSAFAVPYDPPVFEKNKVKFSVYRSEIALVNDRYEFVTTDICKGEITVDVLDLRSMPADAEIIFPTYEACKAVVDGKEKIFYFGSYVHIYKSTSDLKQYMTYLGFHNTDNSPLVVPSAKSAFAATRDLSLKSMLLFSSARQGIVCPPSLSKKIRSKNLEMQMSQELADESKCKVENPLVYGLSVEFETI